MKTYSYSKGFGLSLATALLLGSSAYAGKIIGVDANAPYEATTPPTQHGFGGWNFDNVAVNITSNSDFNDVIEPDIHLQMLETSGTYPVMDDNMSFESKIFGREVGMEEEVRGLLHGKDWPVGEPAGIKVVNDANTSQSEKSPNCIMTTSYLDSGYLNAANPKPTDCASPFQTHKRFKVNMQPATVAGVVPGSYGKPIDLVFNLDTKDTDTAVRRYQVFSKINNYTSMRLDGYKIEVLDENGSVNDNLKFSLDLTTKESDDESGYEATFAHGLWGPIDKHFPENGFFDDVRAGFKQDGNNSTVLTGGSETLAGNYEALFGIWLPSKWAPMGIFWDFDSDPTTDADLVAFWGTAPDAPEGTAPKWLKGEADNWAPVTEADFADWNVSVVGSDYSYGVIEDTLNLGPNYVVEVGENAKIGKTFTIRITPHVAADQTAPSYVDENGTYIVPPQVPVDIVPVDNTPVPEPEVQTTTYVSSSSDGGSCTFNPNSKGVDMTVLLMLAAGLLYPFRRRFIK